ncbi:MAG TPA: hypothetical protein VGH49_02500 [Xanthobacteraceae bacterium]
MNPRPLFLLITTLLAAASVPVPTRAQQMENENLLVQLPTGYKIGFQATRGISTINEMIPAQETVDNWSEMVTVQIFRGLKNLTPQAFRTTMQTQWSAACKGSESSTVHDGEENGYVFSLWLMQCPLNPTTNKPEVTWLKAIKGNDSFYVVQKAFRFSPTKEQVVTWTRYLQTVMVCDSRLNDRKCPPVKAQNAN